MRWLESNDLGLVLVALIGLIGSWFGGARLKEATLPTPKPVAPEKTFEIAGAIISDKKANEIIEAINRLEVAMRDHGVKLMDNTRACEKMDRTLHDMDEAVGKLANEIYLQSRMGK